MILVQSSSKHDYRPRLLCPHRHVPLWSGGPSLSVIFRGHAKGCDQGQPKLTLKPPRCSRCAIPPSCWWRAQYPMENNNKQNICTLSGSSHSDTALWYAARRQREHRVTASSRPCHIHAARRNLKGAQDSVLVETNCCRRYSYIRSA